MKIVGFTNFGFVNHDNSVAILSDGKVVFAEAEERVTRIKHDFSSPQKSLRDGLEQTKFKLQEIDYFVSGRTGNNFLAIFRAYLKGVEYCGFGRFFSWFLIRIFQHFIKREKVYQQDKRNQKKDRSLLQRLNQKPEKMMILSHHLAHASTAYTYSPYRKKVLVVALDGYGLDSDGYPVAGWVYKGEEGKLQPLEEIPVYSSLALYYGASTMVLGFKFNDGEGKTMGLAAYGKMGECVRAMGKIYPKFKNGKWVGNQYWLDSLTVARKEEFLKTKLYKKLASLKNKYGEKNFAYASQKVLEEAMINYFSYLRKKYKIDDFAIAGGIFLNVKLNMRLVLEKVVRGLFIYPNAGDSGIAAGMALEVYFQLTGKRPFIGLESVSLGCEFTDKEIKKELEKFKKKVAYKKLRKSGISAMIADDLVKQKVVGIFFGGGEWGPRALGNRSVLADPRKKSLKNRINDRMKRREWFMPFAPSILYNKAHLYLKNIKESPFMIMADEVTARGKKEIKAAIHIDDTVRPQLVKKEVYPLYHQIIENFYRKTGVAAVLNTSFNKHGLPIVHSPKDAVEHLLWGCIDKLYIGSYQVVVR